MNPLCSSFINPQQVRWWLSRTSPQNLTLACPLRVYCEIKTSRWAYFSGFMLFNFSFGHLYSFGQHGRKLRCQQIRPDGLQRASPDVLSKLWAALLDAFWCNLTPGWRWTRAPPPPPSCCLDDGFHHTSTHERSRTPLPPTCDSPGLKLLFG